MNLEESTDPVMPIAVAAEQAAMHPQTLRQYDRLGLVVPKRLAGKSRRYSWKDVYQLREIQRLSKEGVTLVGIKRILELENQIVILRRQRTALMKQVQQLSDDAERNRVFAAGAQGDVIHLAPGQRKVENNALVVWQTHRY
ncbi:MAG: MerR family transcriptional regulator [Micrococcaceae bacterium]